METLAILGLAHAAIISAASSPLEADAIDIAVTILVAALSAAWCWAWLRQTRSRERPPSRPGLPRDWEDGPHRGAGASSVRAGIISPPPDGLRPAEVAIAFEGQAGPTTLVTMILDLARRGHFGIREMANARWSGTHDWALTRTTPPGADTLTPYEKLLLKSLFQHRKGVMLSRLRLDRSSGLRQAMAGLSAEAEAQGWLPRPPRSFAKRGGVAGLVGIGIGGSLVLMAAVAFGRPWIFAPVALAGAVLIVNAILRSKPEVARAGLRSHLEAFRAVLASPDQRRETLGSRPDLFPDLLPYAIALGCLDGWARGFPDPRADAFFAPAPLPSVDGVPGTDSPLESLHRFIADTRAVVEPAPPEPLDDWVSTDDGSVGRLAVLILEFLVAAGGK